jgi:hypothetical protein
VSWSIHTAAYDTRVLEMFPGTRLPKRSSVPCDLVTLFARIALVALYSSALYMKMLGSTYARFVKPASNTDSLRFAHSMRFLSLFV